MRPDREFNYFFTDYESAVIFKCVSCFNFKIYWGRHHLQIIRGKRLSTGSPVTLPSRYQNSWESGWVDFFFHYSFDLFAIDTGVCDFLQINSLPSTRDAFLILLWLKCSLFFSRKIEPRNNFLKNSISTHQQISVSQGFLQLLLAVVKWMSIPTILRNFFPTLLLRTMSATR